jgi:SNF2 family DNA or RNA helicase
MTAGAPPAVLAAEIDPGESRLYVVISGADRAQITATASRVQYATPLFHMEPGSTRAAVPFSCPLTWPAVVQLVAEFGDASGSYGPKWAPGPRLQEWTRRKAEELVGELPVEASYSPPERQPYRWQIEAQLMVAARQRIFLFDEPGAGKTGSALLGLEEADAWPALVFCPASMVDTWVEEAQIWVPHRSVSAYRGGHRKRLAAHDLLVASFDTGKRDAAELIKRGPKGFVVDELHLIANSSTDRARASRKIAHKVPVFIGLGGTPITHNVSDLHTALTCLEPGAWEDKERWTRRYCLVEHGEYDDRVVGLSPHREPEFRLTLAGRERRVAKADVLAELPEKVYSTRYVEMPAAHRKAYEQMRDDMLAQLPDESGEISVMGALAQLQRLNQMASAPATIEEISIEVVHRNRIFKHYQREGADPDALVAHRERLTALEYQWLHREATKLGLKKANALGEFKGWEAQSRVRLKAPSWKVAALLEVMDERPGKPVVTFAPSRQLIILAGAAAEEAGHRVGYVAGGQTSAQRTAFVKAFQAGELDLLCVTTGAGGVGLTLTASDTAVFLQRPWSYVEASQAEDRLHRPGAEKHESIEIVDVVTRNTVDAKVREVLREKAGELADLLQDRRVAEALFRKAK